MKVCGFDYHVSTAHSLSLCLHLSLTPRPRDSRGGLFNSESKGSGFDCQRPQPSSLGILEQSVWDFWIQQHSEYPALSDKAVHILLSFGTT